MSSPEPRTGAERDAVLLQVARDAVAHGLRTGRALLVDVARFAPGLGAPGASFVTLRRAGALRGCIGSLEPTRPLVADVAQNAFAAAFRDPRFPPLAAGELTGLDFHLSLLGPAEPMRFASEAELSAQLRPGVDGVVLREGARRGTFLPQVWEQIPEPARFLAELKRKAGLPPGHWSERIEVARYTVESIG